MRHFRRIVCIFIVILAVCMISFLIKGIRRYTPFSIDTDGLMAVELSDEKWYTVASGRRKMETEAFEPDDMEIYEVRGLSFWENRIGRLKITDSKGERIAVTKELYNICDAMQYIDHDILYLTIFRIGDELFAGVALNVNLWMPYEFYYYNKPSGRLVFLYEFADRSVVSIRMLDWNKLRSLNQNSIGGRGLGIMPDRLLTWRPELYENAAELMFDHREIFDKALEENHKSCIGDDSISFTYRSLTHDTIVVGTGETIRYLDNSERAVLQALLNECRPYEIEYVPDEQDQCGALVFKYTLFNEEEGMLEEMLLIRLSEPCDENANARMSSVLEERFGSLKDSPQQGWMIAEREPDW